MSGQARTELALRLILRTLKNAEAVHTSASSGDPCDVSASVALRCVIDDANSILGTLDLPDMQVRYDG